LDMAEGDTIRRMLEARYRELGPITFHQAAVLFNFTVLVMLWFFRKPQFIPGNASLKLWLFRKPQFIPGSASLKLWLFRKPQFIPGSFSLKLWFFRKHQVIPGSAIL
jgi:hypothetical protein